MSRPQDCFLYILSLTERAFAGGVTPALHQKGGEGSFLGLEEGRAFFL